MILLITLLLSGILYPQSVKAQNKSRIYGTVYELDGKKSVPLDFATVSFPDFSIGTTTNNGGSYSLNVPQGKVKMRVQYVGKGENYVRLGYKFTGAMRVLETIMRYGYLWTRIRVQGGAYGASVQFARNGLLLLTSYRDPNRSETLRVYDEVADYLKNFTASEREMTKSIIGTISTLDVPMTPQMKGSLAAMLYLRGITQADRQRERDEVLAANVEAIRALAPVVDACMKKDTYCVFGGEEKVRENEQLFSRIERAME